MTASDGYLAGLAQERLLPALHAVNVYPFEQPMQDLGLEDSTSRT